MKFKNIVPSLLAAGLIAVTLTACETERENEHEKGPKETEAQLKAQAKISEADARATVMAKLPNATIKEAELEKEHGKLIWSFDVAVPDSKVTEVNVNAITGALVNLENETPSQKEADEKKEKDDDKK